MIVSYKRNCFLYYNKSVFYMLTKLFQNKKIKLKNTSYKKMKPKERVNNNKNGFISKRN